MLNTERGAVLRTFFALLTLHTWFCGLYEPLSLHFMVTEKAAGLGILAVTMFGMLGLLLLVDAVIYLPTLRDNRLGILMSISLMNAAELFVALHFISSWGLAIYCLLVSSFVAITAFLDIHVRYKKVVPKYA